MACATVRLRVGATKFETAIKVVLPAAISGVAAAFVLGISRAVGETMVVAIAAGQQPNLTLNPMEPAATITAYIVQVALGDLPHGGIGYQSIFAAGLTLLCDHAGLQHLCVLAARTIPGGVLMADTTWSLDQVSARAGGLVQTQNCGCGAVAAGKRFSFGWE